MKFIIQINSLFHSKNYFINAESFDDAIDKLNFAYNFNFEFVDIGIYETNNQRANVFYTSDYLE